MPKEPVCAVPLVLGAPGGTHPPPLAPGLLQEVEARLTLAHSEHLSFVSFFLLLLLF